MSGAKPTISFREIRDDLLEKIRHGHWIPGDRIPGEEDLARDYGCSRTTMSRAIRELVAMNILERRRKAGTWVMRRPERIVQFEIAPARKALSDMEKNYGYRLIQQEILPAPTKLASQMQIDEGARLLHLACLHLCDGLPWQYEDRWINIAAAPGIKTANFTTTPPGEWLMDHIPFSAAQHGIQAVPAPKDVAAALLVDTDSPLLAIHRQTHTKLHYITQVTLYHPANSFSLQAVSGS